MSSGKRESDSSPEAEGLRIRPQPPTLDLTATEVASETPAAGQAEMANGTEPPADAPPPPVDTREAEGIEEPAPDTPFVRDDERRAPIESETPEAYAAKSPYEPRAEAADLGSGSRRVWSRPPHHHRGRPFRHHGRPASAPCRRRRRLAVADGRAARSGRSYCGPCGPGRTVGGGGTPAQRAAHARPRVTNGRAGGANGIGRSGAPAGERSRSAGGEGGGGMGGAASVRTSGAPGASGWRRSMPR